MLVGSDYLHTLNLVPAGLCVLVVGVLVGSGYLHTLLVGVSLWLVLVGSGYLHTLNLVPAGSCVLVVRVCSCVLVGSDYLATLNLVPCWFVSPCVSLLEVITCIP